MARSSVIAPRPTAVSAEPAQDLNGPASTDRPVPMVSTATSGSATPMACASRPPHSSPIRMPARRL